MDEFELIARYFSPLGAQRDDIVCGIGDDGAIIAPAPGQLVVAVDTLVEGQHFPAGSAADLLGFRAAAVNLSDLAAMAATPRYATLALTLPAVDERWLKDFASGLGRALNDAESTLIGGDTTRGPLTVTIQLIGTLEGPALTRDGACAGDCLLVSGTLGDARAALEVLKHGTVDEQSTFLLERYWRPTPRLALARAVRAYAHAAIDISDGLLADLGHLATASTVRMVVEREALPLSDALIGYCGVERARDYALGGGDDYELVFCVPSRHREAALGAAKSCGETLTVIGRVESGAGVICCDRDGHEVTLNGPRGFRHFE